MIRTMRLCLVFALSLISFGSASALGQPSAEHDPPAEGPAPQPALTSGDSICLMIEAAARANDLPVDYFARVIWQESRFQPDVVGPRTRNGQRAQGIAQFMPETAAERRDQRIFEAVVGGKSLYQKRNGRDFAGILRDRLLAENVTAFGG